MLNNITYLILLAYKKLLAFTKFVLVLSLFSMVSLAVLMVTPVFSNYLLFLLNNIPVSVSSTHVKQPASMILVLGGGLRKKSNQEIVLNKYTKQRLQTVVKLHREKQLPIFFSGVEAKWAKNWLLENKISTKKLILEGKSLNTCENANFSAIKLKQLGINHVFLVTDAYHQQRAKLNFANNGIYTTAISASLSKHQKGWDTPKLNFDNNRRAIYEILAVLRDKYRPQTGKDCLKVPRKNAKPNFDEFNLKRLLGYTTE